MTRWTLRGKALLQRRALAIALLCCGVALLGGWLAYGAHVDPGTHQERQVVSTFETTQSFDHRSTVVNDSTLFAEGATVADRDVYYTAYMPELDGTYAFTYDASGSGSLDLRSEATLLARSVGDRGDKRVTYWEFTRPLGAANATDLQPGERVTLSTDVDVDAIGDRVRRIRNELETTGGQVELSVRVDTTYEGTVDGRSIDRRVNDTLAIDYRTNEYHVTDDGTERDTYNATAAIAVPNSPGPLGRFGGPLLLATGSIGVLALVVARHWSALETTPGDRERLAYADDRAEYAEWLTTVTLPASSYDGPAGEAATLGDLVDVAIDSDSAVMHDAERDRYVVFAEGNRYEYHPPTADPLEDDPLSEGGGVLGSMDAEADEERAEPTSDQSTPGVAADGSGDD